jgi:hypothetical protein
MFETSNQNLVSQRLKRTTSQNFSVSTYESLKKTYIFPRSQNQNKNNPILTLKPKKKAKNLYARYPRGTKINKKLDFRI